MLGNLLRDRETQYIATKDEGTRTWRILDTWHDDLRAMDPEDDIPDDCAAVNILTEGAFIALVKEAARTGVLQNATGDSASMFDGIKASYVSELEEKDQEIVEIKKKLVKYEEEMNSLRLARNKSEGTILKEMAMETLLKLTLASDVEKLTHQED